MLLVMCIWKKEFIMQVEKRGSLSVLEAEPSSLFSLECLESVNGGQFLRMASADLMSSTMCAYE